MTGLPLPIWDLISQENPEVIRIASAGGESWLGRVIRDEYVAELGEALGVGIDHVVTASTLIERLERSGKPVAVPGSGGVTIQQSRVNNQMRLEIKGFEPSRLTWYKSLGCFTEIVQFKARLFAPDAKTLLAAIDRFCLFLAPETRVTKHPHEAARSAAA